MVQINADFFFLVYIQRFVSYYSWNVLLIYELANKID